MNTAGKVLRRSSRVLCGGSVGRRSPALRRSASPRARNVTKVKRDAFTHAKKDRVGERKTPKKTAPPCLPLCPWYLRVALRRRAIRRRWQVSPLVAPAELSPEMRQVEVLLPERFTAAGLLLRRCPKDSLSLLLSFALDVGPYITFSIDSILTTNLHVYPTTSVLF
jgi:hypothetical protein